MVEHVAALALFLVTWPVGANRSTDGHTAGILAALFPVVPSGGLAGLFLPSGNVVRSVHRSDPALPEGDLVIVALSPMWFVAGLGAWIAIAFVLGIVVGQIIDDRRRP